MLASNPASMVNQKRPDLGIRNRFKLTSSRFRRHRASRGTGADDSHHKQKHIEQRVRIDDRLKEHACRRSPAARSLVFKAFVVQRQRDDVDGTRFMRRVDEPRRRGVLVADGSVDRFSLVLSDADQELMLGACPEAACGMLQAPRKQPYRHWAQTQHPLCRFRA
jgi:hypothetical protein